MEFCDGAEITKVIHPFIQFFLSANSYQDLGFGSGLIGKDPDAGNDCSQRRGQQRMRWLDYITDSVDMNLSQTLGDREGP